VADKINKVVKANFYDSYNKNKSLPLKTVLTSLAKEGLVELRYEEIRNDDRFFSFVIHHEWLAAYPTYDQVNYAFNKQTGEYLTLDNLILPEKWQGFKKLVITMWKDAIENYRKKLQIQMKANEIDATDYATAMGYIKDDCVESFSPKEFRLSIENIEVFFECGFPRILTT